MAMPWRLVPSTSIPGFQYYYNNQTGVSFGEVWERRESRSSPGTFYYRNVDTNATSIDPPIPWSKIASRGRPGTFWYFNECSGERSLELPVLLPLRAELPVANAARELDNQDVMAQADFDALMKDRLAQNAAAEAAAAEAAAAREAEERAAAEAAARRAVEEEEAEKAAAEADAKKKAEEAAALAAKEKAEAEAAAKKAAEEKAAAVAAQAARKKVEEEQKKAAKAEEKAAAEAKARKEAEEKSVAEAAAKKKGEGCKRKLPATFGSRSDDSASDSDSNSDSDSDSDSDSAEPAAVTPQPKQRTRALHVATPHSKERKLSTAAIKKIKHPNAPEKSAHKPEKEPEQEEQAEAEEEPKKKKKKAKKEKPDPAHVVEFEAASEDKKVRKFWNFFTDAVKGERSKNGVTRPYVLGGLSVLLPDVQLVCQKILVQHSQVADILWHVMSIVYFGSGGPGFASYEYFACDGYLFGKKCPQQARLPSLSAGEAALRPFYDHAYALAWEHGRHELLAGDGTYPLFRFEADQGLPLLEAFRATVVKFLALLDDGCCGDLNEHRQKQLRLIDPSDVKAFFLAKERKGLGPLAVKELYCYLNPIFPHAFDASFTPWGPGALRGGKLIVGECSQTNASSKVTQYIANMPSDLRADLAAQISTSLMLLPKEVRQLPGIAMQLESKAPSVLDVEVCTCWFQSYLKAIFNKPPHEVKAPPKWKGFSRDMWKKSVV